MPPIDIKYYRCTNQGYGIVIYPQLRSANNPEHIIWDGREVPGFSYMIPVGGQVIVNLTSVGVPENTPFYLSENTFLGTDIWCPDQVFVHDPNSNIMATAQRSGPSHSGDLQWMGNMPHNPFEWAESAVQDDATSLVIHEVLHQLGQLTSVEEGGVFSAGEQYAGTVQWQAVIPAAITTIATALIVKGYTVTFATTNKKTMFTIAPKKVSADDGEANSVPAKVKQDWAGAVKAAVQWKPNNLGIVEVKKSSQ